MKKILLLIGILTFFQQLSFAQKPETPAIKRRIIDSLNNTLKTISEHNTKQNDTIKVNIYFGLIKRAKRDTAKLYITEVKKICNNYSSIVANSENINDIEIKKGINNDSFLFFYLKSKAKIIRLEGNYEDSDDKSLQLYLNSLKLCEKINDKDGTADCYLGISYIFFNQSNADKAIENELKAQSIYKEIDNKDQLSKTYFGIGQIYYERNQFDKAVQNFTIALEISKKSGNLFNSGTYYEYLGFAYTELQNYDKALENQFASLKISEQMDDIKGVADSYRDIADIYTKKRDYKNALENQKNALKKYIEFSHPALIGMSYYDNSKVYCDLKMYDDALENLFTSLKIYESLKKENEIIEIHFAISEVYTYKHDYLKSIDYLKKGIGKNDKLKNLEFYQRAYKKLSEIYAKLNEYKTAYHYHELYVQMNDSVHRTNDKTKGQIETIETKFNKEKKEQEKKLQDAQLAQKEAQIKQEKTQKFALYGGLALTLLLAGVSYRNFRRKKKDNVIITNQKQLVEEKQKEILDSIEYALRIQTAILPTHKIVKQYLENSFILYKPKDIVAGDFYWMETVNDLVLFAACDCTGHGVPGAMVSVVCHNALNRAVREFGLTQPAAILDKTAEIVIENFSKSEEDIKDGMDISLCAYNAKTKTIQWAGANNPLWLLQNGELIETKADKQPIGMNDNSKPFTNHTFTLQTGVTIYLFTDGFADQFGGDTGQKKLTKKRFKDLILSVQDKTMQEQGIALDKFITEYRKSVEQIDDILVMGVKV